MSKIIVYDIDTGNFAACKTSAKPQLYFHYYHMRSQQISSLQALVVPGAKNTVVNKRCQELFTGSDTRMSYLTTTCLQKEEDSIITAYVEWSLSCAICDKLFGKCMAERQLILARAV